MISKVEIIIVDIKKGGAMVEKSLNQNDFRKVILIKCETKMMMGKACS